MQLVNTKPGRPKAKPKTVKILAKGEARLSYDLAEDGDRFIAAFTGKKKIHLIKFDEKKHKGKRPLTAWSSSIDAQSPIVSLQGTITAMGLELINVVGEYRATKAKNIITIDLEKRT